MELVRGCAKATADVCGVPQTPMPVKTGLAESSRDQNGGGRSVILRGIDGRDLGLRAEQERGFLRKTFKAFPSLWYKELMLRAIEGLPESVCTCLTWSPEDRRSGCCAHSCWDRSRPHLVILEEGCQASSNTMLASSLPNHPQRERCNGRLPVYLALRSSAHQI